MAPTYTGLAIANAPEAVAGLLEGRHELDDSAENYANFDWTIQHQFTLLSQNSVFIMIVNGFKDLFLNLAPYYFSIPSARKHSLKYYNNMSQSAQDGDARRASLLTEEIMRESLDFWAQTKFY
jgi:GntR family negative regulator for fad regulon and positive regulator of fabA